MPITTLSTKYQIVIPKEIRKKSKLKPHKKMEVSLIPNSHYILLRPIKKGKLTQYYKGLAKKTLSKINLDKYIKEAKESWEK